MAEPDPSSRPSAVAADAKDLARAQMGQNKAPRGPWWATVGPGLVTGAADDDPSGIGTYSQSGAAFGYGQLWLLLFSLPLMISVQEMCGRLGLVTGKGLAAVMRERYSKWLGLSCLALLVVANVLNIFADLNVMAASGKMLWGESEKLWLSIFAAFIILAEIFIPYHFYSKILKYLCLSLIGYGIVAVLPQVHTDWGQVGYRLFIPDFSSNFGYLLSSVAFLGTTISPYLFYWQAGETVEEVISEGAADAPGRRKTRVKDTEIRNLRADTVFGMVASQFVAFFIMVSTAATLHVLGKTNINTAQDAAQALRPLGPAAYWLFSLGMIGTGLLAIPTLAGSAAYAIAETFGWRYGLYRRFARAPAFYVSIGVAVAIGCGLNFVATVSPIKALVYSAVLNGIVAVPILVVLVLICNNREIVGDRKNGVWSNVFGWAAVAAMGLAGAFFAWAALTGRAS